MDYNDFFQQLSSKLRSRFTIHYAQFISETLDHWVKMEGHDKENETKYLRSK